MKYGFDNVKFRVIFFVYNSVKKGFTLLELLLVIAIIAALASLIFFTLSPADRLNDANAAKTLASARDLEKAIKTYIVSNAGNLPSSLQNISQPGIFDICKTGQTIGCINLDELVAAGTLSSIPEDANNSTQYLTGYKLKYSPSANYFNVYLKNDYDNELVFCPPGDFNCTPPYTQWLLNENAGLNVGDSLGTYTSTISGATWVDGYEGSGLFF